MTTDGQFVLVVLNTAPGLEELVVDWLLGREGERGFTSTRIHGHSAEHDGLTQAEQVSGRRERVQFEIHMPAGRVSGFLGDAAAEFGVADVHCMVLPVIAAGRLSRLVPSGE